MYTTGLTQPLGSAQGNSTEAPADTNNSGAHDIQLLTIVLEQTPAALARVYSVLCLMNLVPDSFNGSQEGDGAIRIDFTFGSVTGRRLDLLIRKLAQLTECLEVAETPARHRAAC